MRRCCRPPQNVGQLLVDDGTKKGKKEICRRKNEEKTLERERQGEIERMKLRRRGRGGNKEMVRKT